MTNCAAQTTTQPLRRLAGLLPAGTASYAVAKVVPAAASFCGVLVFIRLAGAGAYGVYSIAFAAAVFSCSLTSGWLVQACLRFAGDPSAPAEAIRRWSLWVSFLAAGAATAVIVGLTLSSWQPDVAFGAGVLAIAVAAQGFVVALLQSELAQRKVVLAEAVRALLQLAVPVLALLLLARNGIALLLAMAVAVVLAVLPFGQTLLPLGRRERPMAATAASGPAPLRMWWTYGWPMSLWLSIAAVLQFSDRILIARWKGPAQAGAYAGIYDILNGGLAVCLFPITMAAYPRVSRLWNAGHRRDALRENTRALRAQFLVFVPVLLCAIPFRDLFVRIVLGYRSPAGVALVLPLLLGAFSWQLALTAHKRLEMEHRTKTMLLFALISAIVNVVGNVLTIPRYGAAAAAWTTFLSAAMYLALCVGWRRMHPAHADAAGPPASAQVTSVRGRSHVG